MEVLCAILALIIVALGVMIIRLRTMLKDQRTSFMAMLRKFDRKNKD